MDPILLALILLFVVLAVAVLLTEKRVDSSATSGAMPVGLSDEDLISSFLRPPEQTKERLSDVRGMPDVVAEVEALLHRFANPEQYADLPPLSGILLIGDAGTGKTYLARAMAGEASCAFYALSLADLARPAVDTDGGSLVQRLFDEARENAPAIIFIDELNTGMMGDEQNPYRETLSDILVTMDGFDDRGDVLVVAATNDEENLDPALVRPGRFDHVVRLNPPDKQGRLDILEYYAARYKVGTEHLRSVAEMTAGFTGADLAHLLSDAKALAIRSGESAVTLAHLGDAYDRLAIGGGNRFSLTGELRRMVCLHEAGHAFVAHYFNQPLQRISLVGRGGSLGYVLFHHNDEQMVQTREACMADLAIVMGGRAAELVFLGQELSSTTGDLQRARHLAFSMVFRWAMAEGKIFFNPEDRRVAHHAQLFMAEGLERARRIIAANQETVERLAAFISEREVVSADELKEFLADLPIVTVESGGTGN